MSSVVRKLRIGISASFSHPDPTRALFKGKRLTYVEESLTHWLATHGAIVYLVPSRPDQDYGATIGDLDGLVLQGGVDVDPRGYGEEPLKTDWSGDKFRDEYELKLIQACRAHKVPLLGVCRGLQILNVALGGSLYQDLGTQVTGSLDHRNWEIYDKNTHGVELVAGTKLAELYRKTLGDKLRGEVNSVHHQGIKKLAPGFIVEAKSVPDGIVEAIRFQGDEYLVGIQWHPEFQTQDDRTLLPADPVLQDFLRAAGAKKGKP